MCIHVRILYRVNWMVVDGQQNKEEKAKRRRKKEEEEEEWKDAEFCHHPGECQFEET